MKWRAQSNRLWDTNEMRMGWSNRPVGAFTAPDPPVAAPVLWDNSSPVLWDNGSPVLWS